MLLSPHRPFPPRGFPIFYGWIIVVVGTLGLIGTIPGQTGGVGVFTDILMERLGLSRLQISTAYLLGTGVSGLLLPFGGRFFDRVGARATGALSAICLGSGVIVLSQSDRIVGRSGVAVLEDTRWLPGFILLSGGFLALRFMGQGMLTLASRAMITKWFQWRRGLVTSISSIVFTLALAVAPKVLNLGIIEIGWRNTWIATGFVLIFIIGSLALVFFRDNPEECGLVMDGGPPPPGRKVSENPDTVFVRDFTLKEALRTPSLYLFSAPFIVLSSVFTGFAFHILSVGREAGFEAGRVLDVFLYAAAVSIPTNFLAGYICDRTRLMYLLALNGLFMALAAAGLLCFGSDLSIFLTAIGFGVSSGLFHLLSGVVWPRYYGRTHLGAISGFFMSSTVIGSATGPWIFGIVFDRSGGYLPIYWVTLAFGVLFAVTSFAAKNPQRLLAAEAGTDG